MDGMGSSNGSSSRSDGREKASSFSRMSIWMCANDFKF